MRLTKPSLLWLLLVTSPIWPGDLLANETPYDLRPEQVAQINYDPFTGLPAREKLRINLDLSEFAASDLATALEQYRGRRLRIRIRPSNNGSFSAAGERQNLPINVSRARGQRGFSQTNNEVYQDLVIRNNLRARVFEFLLSVPAAIYADPGTFTLPLNMELVDLDSNTILSVAELNVKAIVGVRLQTNIAGASGNRNTNSRFAMVNFGSLETGETQAVSIQVRGNASADITLTSENDGRLRHRRHQDLFVDYSVEVDGEPSNLENPLNLTRSVEKTIQGSAYPMKITIGDVSKAFSGPYRDVITVEVRPKLN